MTRLSAIVIFGVIWLVSGLLSHESDHDGGVGNGPSPCPSWLAATRCRLRCLEQQLLRTSSSATSSMNNEKDDDVVKKPPPTVDALDTIGMRLCTQNAICLSCLMPCDKDDVELKNCDQVCKDALAKSKSSCDASCEFATNMTCSAMIRPTNDTTIRCSRSTVSASFGDNESGVAVPENDDGNRSCSEVEDESFDISRVTVSESWETRGIHVRWKVEETSCCGRRWLPVIYAIQMHQLVGGVDDSDEDESIASNDWAVLTTTMSKSLNLVNVLTLGLRYRLRIVAVSSSTIRSVSSASRAFGLPKEIPVPGAPRNLSFSRSKSGVMSVTVHWDSPAREGSAAAIAVSDYLVTVIKENSEETEEEEHTVLLDARQRISGQRATSVHQHRRSYKLVNVDPNATYIVRISAVIQHSGRQFIGEAAVLKIHSAYKRPISSGDGTADQASTGINHDRQPAAVDNLVVQAPFYLNGSLRAIVNWNYDNELRNVVQRFILGVQTESCASFVIGRQFGSGGHKKMKKGKSSLEDRLNSTGHGTRAPVRLIYVDQREFTYELKALGFECVYKVNVFAAFSMRGHQSPASHSHFETPPCYQGSVIPKYCPRRSPKNLVCQVRTSKAEHLKLCCQWEWDAVSDDDDAIGFLVTAVPYYVQLANESTPHPRPTIHQTVGKDVENEVLLHNLIPNSKYHVSVRAIGGTDNELLLGPPAQLQSHVPVNYPLGALYVSWMSSRKTLDSINSGGSTTTGAAATLSPVFKCLMVSFVYLIMSTRD